MTAPQQFTIRDQRKPGWFYVDNEIVDDYGVQLGAYGVAVYGVLSRHERNHQVKLSQRDIAASLGISHDRVGKSLGDLAECGLIHVEVPTRPSPGVVSTIFLLDVKTSGRHTASSNRELDATRPRNKEEKTNTETLHFPPNPPSGGLTARQLNNLSKEMGRLANASIGTRVTEDEILQQACVNLILPLDESRRAIARSYGEKPDDSVQTTRL